MLLLLSLFLISLAACGGAPGRATATPLPPGEPIAQPTPDFFAAAQAGPQASSATPTAVVSTEPVSAEPVLDPVQARLATAVAQREAAVSSQPASGPAVPAPDASNAALVRPTSLGIVGAGGGVLYSTPGSGIIRSLPAGSTLTITGRTADGAAYAVYLDDGTAGWVNRDVVTAYGDSDQLEVVSEAVSPAIVATLLAEAGAPQPPIATPRAVEIQPAPPTTGEREASAGGPLPGAGPSAVIVVAGANVRAGPGTDYPIVGTLALDDRVALLARNEAADWVQIELEAGTGWLYVPLIQADVAVETLPLSAEVSAQPEGGG